MPFLTLGIAMGNGCLQWKISDANAERIIKACDEFRAVNGRYPLELNELVPKYLPSIPPAKYSMMGKFFTATWIAMTNACYGGLGTAFTEDSILNIRRFFDGI